MVIDSNTILIFGGVIGVILTVGGIFTKIHRWVIKQEEQDVKINNLQIQLNDEITKLDTKYDNQMRVCRDRHDVDIEKILKDDTKEFNEIKVELKLLTYSVLACLKGIRDKDLDNGSNEAIVDAIKTIEKHINEQAHT